MSRKNTYFEIEDARRARIDRSSRSRSPSIRSGALFCDFEDCRRTLSALGIPKRIAQTSKPRYCIWLAKCL